MNNTLVEESEKFKGVRDAVSFALNFSDQSLVPRSATCKAADGPSRNGTGPSRSGLDGAAQAGMLKARIAKAGPIIEACLIARVCPRYLPCCCGSTCCSGNKLSIKWFDAVAFLSEAFYDYMQSQRDEGARGLKNDANLRKLLVARFFGVSNPLTIIATQVSASPATIGTHWKFVSAFLKQHEAIAWKMLEEDLQSINLIS